MTLMTFEEFCRKSRRSRAQWNDCLARWERPASDSEESKIERAAKMVRGAISKSSWLMSEGVTVEPQGSYHNNTNVRLDADMDLRVVHPALKIQYHPRVDARRAYEALEYGPVGCSLASLRDRMRTEIASSLRREFGSSSVDDTGKKAIRVAELPGSRAKVDVVAAFGLHFVGEATDRSRYFVTEGVAILLQGNSDFTFNFPEQHYLNGVAKRERTRLRFKRQVRVFKHLRNELADVHLIARDRAPSFLVECLIYSVEDDYFLVEGDDRYDRARRVASRLVGLTESEEWIGAAREINGIKLMFGPWQGWQESDARSLAYALCSWLEA